MWLNTSCRHYQANSGYRLLQSWDTVGRSTRGYYKPVSSQSSAQGCQVMGWLGKQCSNVWDASNAMTKWRRPVAVWGWQVPAQSHFCRRSHQLSGDKCNNMWVLVGEGVSSPATHLKGFVSLEGVYRPKEIHFGASCVGNLSTYSSPWLVVVLFLTRQSP